MAYESMRAFTASAVGVGDTNFQMPGFVGQAWSKRLVEKFEQSTKILDYCGRDYEGEIKGVGDSVRIFEINPLNARAYTIPYDNHTTDVRAALPSAIDTGGVVYDVMGGNSMTVQVTEAEYAAAQIEDMEEFFANPKYFNKAATEVGKALALSADLWVLTAMQTAAATATADSLGRAGGTSALTNDVYEVVTATQSAVGDSTWDNEVVYNALVGLGLLMDDELVPDEDRFIYLPTVTATALLRDDRFVAAGSAFASQAIKQGYVGDICGLKIHTLSRKLLQYYTAEYAGPDGLAANSSLLNHDDGYFVATGGTTRDYYQTIAGVKGAFQFVNAITKNENIRMQNAFANGIRSLHVYGGKAIRPNHLFKIRAHDWTTHTSTES